MNLPNENFTLGRGATSSLINQRTVGAIDVIFCAFIIANSFLVVRNLVPVYVFLPFSLAISIIIFGRAKFYGTSIELLYFIFMIYTAFVAVWSIAYNPEISVLIQVPRLFVITILPILIFRTLRGQDVILFSIKVLLGCYVLAAISYLYQIYFGAIEWFSDEPMERGTVYRYATNLGSGNIYGIGVGSAIVLTWVMIRHAILRSIIIILLLIGVMLSLQKAGFVNMLMAFVVIFILENKNKRLVLALLTMTFFSALYFWVYLFPFSTIGIYAAEFLNNTLSIDIFQDGTLRRDTTLDGENISERIAGLHVDAILSQHSIPIVILFGVGITGAGGGMGLPEYLQAHSTYWDLFFVGGVPYLFVTVCMMILTQRALARRSDKLSRMFYWSNWIFVVNMTSASAAIFHPILALPFWLSLAHSSTLGSVAIRNANPASGQRMHS